MKAFLLPASPVVDEFLLGSGQQIAGYLQDWNVPFDSKLSFKLIAQMVGSKAQGPSLGPIQTIHYSCNDWEDLLHVCQSPSNFFAGSSAWSDHLQLWSSSQPIWPQNRSDCATDTLHLLTAEACCSNKPLCKLGKMWHAWGYNCHSFPSLVLFACLILAKQGTFPPAVHTKPSLSCEGQPWLGISEALKILAFAVSGIIV